MKLEFTGELAPGETITIDTKEKTMLKEGQNAIHEIEGLHDFDLAPGTTNNIVYEDNEGSREVLIQVRQSGRYT